MTACRLKRDNPAVTNAVLDALGGVEDQEVVVRQLGEGRVEVRLKKDVVSSQVELGQDVLRDRAAALEALSK